MLSIPVSLLRVEAKEPLGGRKQENLSYSGLAKNGPKFPVSICLPLSHSMGIKKFILTFHPTVFETVSFLEIHSGHF